MERVKNLEHTEGPLNNISLMASMINVQTREAPACFMYGRCAVESLARDKLKDRQRGKRIGKYNGKTPQSVGSALKRPGFILSLYSRLRILILQLQRRQRHRNEWSSLDRLQ